MGSILESPDFIPGVIALLHSAKKSREEVLDCLRLSHENKSALFPPVSYRDVNFWYASFDNKNYNFNQKPTYLENAELEKLPVLDKILHQVGVDDQKSVLKVCTTFKNKIEKEKRLFDLIDVRMNRNSFYLRVTEGINETTVNTTFNRRDDGCEIVCNQDRNMSEKTFIEAGLLAFEETIEKIHTKVKKMVIKHNAHRVHEAEREMFHNGIIASLQKLKERLHVESLEIILKTPEQIESILSGVKLEHLIDLTIKIQNENPILLESNRLPQMISLLPQLHLLIIDARIDLKVQSIAHIPHVTIYPHEAITPEELLAYKDALLNSPQLCYHGIWDRHTREMARNWEMALRPYSNNGEDVEYEADDNVFTGSFSYEDGNRLVFKIDNDILSGIRFHRKKP